MAAQLHRLRTKADRLRSDTAAQLRQLVLALLRQVCSQPQQTRAFCARSPPSQAIAEQAPSRGRGRVVLDVWLRDVLGALDDQHRLGQDARIGRRTVAGIGEAPVLRQALADDLLR